MNILVSYLGYENYFKTLLLSTIIIIQSYCLTFYGNIFLALWKYQSQISIKYHVFQNIQYQTLHIHSSNSLKRHEHYCKSALSNVKFDMRKDNTFRMMISKICRSACYLICSNPLEFVSGKLF